MTAVTEQRRRLIQPAWLPLAYAVLAVSLAGLVAFGIALHGNTDPTAFDSTMRRWFTAHLGDTIQRVLLDLSDPKLVIALIAGIVVVALLARRWDVAVLAALSPSLAIVLTEVVLKPVVARRFDYVGRFGEPVLVPGYAFPSGHETGLTSLTAVLALVVCQLRLRTGARVGATVVLALWTVAGAVGLVRSYYHYSTDVIGAVCVSALCVVAVAMAVDAAAPAVARRVSRRRQLT